jgi:asparagine synthase (glutamine-hydrolysing)
MCGLAGIARSDERGVSPTQLSRMAEAIRHRGPDGFGLFSGARCGLAHVRLSIIDVAGGGQPLGNEDGRVRVVYNGEVYNYVELRDELRARGHRFRTRSDTEVLVHAYEEWGADMLARLNGQFAFALYDDRDESVFLARDRFGVCPLVYAERNGSLYFASEAKALFASGEVDSVPDLEGLDEVLTFWGARAPRTVFRGVRALEPGCYARWRNGTLSVRRYYEIAYPEAGAGKEPEQALSQLDALMRSGVALRMRADVPVGGYLSGGLDSSIACSLAAGASPRALNTFSVTFDDSLLDESDFQGVVARDLGTRHYSRAIRPGEIAAVFPDVVRHAETPLLRTAAAPLFLLSRLTREHDIKVVLTGEGSDELFLGYDLFKETAVRLFCLRQPHSSRRPRLFDRLYPYLGDGGRTGGGEMWRQFFLRAGPIGDQLFSHLPRFQLASWAKNFYSDDVRAALAGHDSMQQLRDSLPPAFAGWSPMNRAAYLEITTLLSSYLLSSQGERMAMAHGVEARFPFLDHRLFEFAAALPTDSKLFGLREKDILRRWAADLIPASVRERPKQPYRAPDVPAFFGPGAPEYVRELLEPSALRSTGLFDADAVTGLVARCRTARATGARESQALVAILSAQLWHHQFFEESSAVGAGRGADLELHEGALDDAGDRLALAEAR